MRPLLAFGVIAGILGGLQTYMLFRPQIVREAIVRVEHRAAGNFRLELLATAALGPDAFALDSSEAAALDVSYLGHSVVTRTEPLDAGQPLVVEPIEGLVEGANEFFVRCWPQDTTAQVPLAVRLRILRDDAILSEQTLWSEAGEPVQAAVRLDLPASQVNGKETP